MPETNPGTSFARRDDGAPSTDVPSPRKRPPSGKAAQVYRAHFVNANTILPIDDDFNAAVDRISKRQFFDIPPQRDTPALHDALSPRRNVWCYTGGTSTKTDEGGFRGRKLQGSAPDPGTDLSVRPNRSHLSYPRRKVIVLNLSCDREHLFEGWFASADAFESQSKRGQVECPACGSTRISRRPTAPYLNTKTTPASSRPAAPSTPAPKSDAAAVAMALLRRLGKESEDVGERFAEEARRIHYGEREARNIKGQASRDDVSELLDEGIMVLPIPADEDGLH